MIPVTSFAGRTVAVFGLGASGLAAARALTMGGAGVCCWDDGAAGREAALKAGFALTDLRDADWSEFAALVLAPGVPLTHPEPHWTVRLAQDAGAGIIGDTELFERERSSRAPHSRLAAITGTNGKSTTTALVHHILKSAGRKAELGGNIGVPVLNLPDVSDDTVYAVEFSSYQIDLTPGLSPSVGVLLNVSQDHLERHGTLEHYAAIKARLAQAAADQGIAVIGVDDDISAGIAEKIEKEGGRVLRISALGQIERGVYAEEGRLFQALGDSVQELADLNGIASLRGAHNAQNAAAAFAACRALGLAPQQIAAGLESFPGLAHRMQEIARKGRVIFVNDSKATNADAAARALSSFETVYWIAGGRAKSGGIAALAPYFPRIAHAYLIGEAAESFAKTLEGKVPFTISGDLDSAVAKAAADAAISRKDEPVVLLAPACASFDQYRNFEVRGEAFGKAVEMVLGGS